MFISLSIYICVMKTIPILNCVYPDLVLKLLTGWPNSEIFPVSWLTSVTALSAIYHQPQELTPRHLPKDKDQNIISWNHRLGASPWGAAVTPSPPLPGESLTPITSLFPTHKSLRRPSASVLNHKGIVICCEPFWIRWQLFGYE